MDNPTSKAGYKSVHNDDDTSPPRHGFATDEPYKVEDTSLMRSENKSFWERWNSYWVWELVTCVISMGCLGVVIWALVHMDGSELSTWPLQNRWTLSSFLSSFVTLSRFMMLVGVAEGIGQLRWLYYLGGSRRLDHLDSFESASRGAWGSILFVFRKSIKGIAPFIARIGAIIMIVALAMDPFTQQLLAYSTGPSYHENSADAWISAVNASFDNSSSILTDAARRQSIYGSVLNFTQTPSYNCASGNCTWNSFTSLGYDIACQSVANNISKECVTGYGNINQNCSAIRYYLPDGNLSLVLQNGSHALNQVTNDTRTFSLMSSTTSDPYPAGQRSPIIFSFLMAQLLIQVMNSTFNTDNLRNPSWNLTRCDAKWSSYLYEGVNVINGTFNDVLPITLDLVPLENSTCWTQPEQGCREFTPLNASATPSGSSSVFYIQNDTNPATIRSLLDFEYNLTVNGPDFQPNNNANGAYSLATGLFWNVDLVSTFKFSSISLTNYFRSAPWAYHVRGTAVGWTTYVHVRWGWFALPAAANLAGPIFLLCVIFYTARGVGGERLIWKTNTVPFLMHGLEGYRRHEYAGAETYDAILGKARHMTVQLRRNENGEIRFVNTGSHDDANAQ